MAFSKITTRGMSGDTLEAGDIAANAIGASELADDAVDTAAIASGAVTAPKVVDGLIEVKPHIKPGTLYPAVNGMINYDSQYTFTDSSGTPKTITAVGDTHHIGNPKIGTTSIRLDGDDYLTVAAHSDFNFGTSDFCIEFWWKGTFGANDQFFAFGASGEYWVFYQEAANKLRVTMGSAGTRQFDTDSSTVWENTGDFVHFAITKTGTSCKLYINGVEETTINGSYTNNPAASIDLSSFTLSIGANPSGSYPLNASNIDEFRISNHIRYSGNFTPSTTAFSNDANTKFLLHSDNGGNSGAYGTAQTDGLSYYYTDIKGSKPIKDPRIGAHFGSQRHKVRSLQKLEQETATHEDDVYSIDGREWMRYIGGDGTDTFNDSSGQGVHMTNAGDTLEITGYFSDMNFSMYSGSSYDNYTLHIDGGKATSKTHPAAVASPLAGRYVDPSSVVNVGLGATLGIHTVKIIRAGESLYFYNIELIAQDTTSTTTRSQIQIPAQNVVSYGKKFSISATATHYNPFDGWSGAKTLTELGTFIDTATSLGMDNWKAGTSNYYKPFNGGRVVKWIDSSGAIKTSVTMMPPNAQNIGTTASNAFSDGEVQAGTNNHTITFNTREINNSLSEVAKTFHTREFGNGAANAGTGATWADASMLTASTDNIAYVMDDGLTSLTADGVQISADSNGLHVQGTNESYCVTFIGTGLTIVNNTDFADSGGADQMKKYTLVQNLPYGTHVLEFKRTSTYTASTIKIDGVQIHTGWIRLEEVTFHQPKKPPIPEDAVVLADYMLMADYVQNTSATIGTISKGARRIGGSRDHFYDCSGAIGALDTAVVAHPFFWSGAASHASNAMPVSIPYFGTSFTSHAHDQSGTHTFTLDGSAVTPTELDTDGIGQDMFYHAVSTLGLHTKVHTLPAGGFRFQGTDVATPIHTSSHYQAFETPWLYELVGGDRNMEQHNLVVTPDGKSWDEVTRDTSYIGNSVLSATVDHNQDVKDTTIIMEEWRGNYSQYTAPSFNKDFAIAYDRVICLKDGWYEIYSQQHSNDSLNDWSYFWLRLNGAPVSRQMQQDYDWHACSLKTELLLKRGDYMDMQGLAHVNEFQFQIKRLGK